MHAQDSARFDLSDFAIGARGCSGKDVQVPDGQGRISYQQKLCAIDARASEEI